MSSGANITTLVRRSADAVRVGVTRLAQRAAASWSLSQLFVLLGRSGGGKWEVSQPFGTNTTVYSGITAIAQTLAGMRMTLHRGDPEQPLRGGPAFELLNNPCPGCDWPMLCEQAAGHLVESGEVHIFDPEPLNLRPLQLLAVGKRQMTPEIRGGRLLWWWFEQPPLYRRVPIVPEADGFRKLFHPYDGLRGLSPLAAAELNIKQSYMAGTYNSAMLENGGAPGGVYTVPGRLSAEEKKEIQQVIKQRHESPDNANRPLLGWGGLDYKATAGKPTDLELKELQKFNREEILSALGVPPVLAGVFESAHYDVADQAIVIFLVHKLSPLARSIESVFNRQVLPRVEPGVQIAIDTADHPAMLSLISSKLDALGKAVKTGVPYNEAAAMVGLKLKPQTWGERSLLEGGLQTAEDVLAGLEPPPEEGRDESGEEEEQSGALHYDAHEHAHEHTREDEQEAGFDEAGVASERREEERAIRAAMPRVHAIFRATFARQTRQVLARLRREVQAAGNGEKGTARNWPWEKAGEHERVAARVLLDLASETRRLKLLVRNYFPDSVKAALRGKLKALGWREAEIAKTVSRLTSGKTIKSLIRIQEGKIAGVERVTRRRVYASIIEGLDKNETVTQISERVRSAIGGEDQARALRIARAESGQAVSLGRFMATSAAGVKGKGWLAGRNPRVSHSSAGNRYDAGHPIPIDQPFLVGGEALMFPRDPRGSAEQIINCNCTLIPRRLPTTERDE